jgi:hypothetical protein
MPSEFFMYPFWRLNRVLFLPACRLYSRKAMAADHPGHLMVLLSSLEFLMAHRYWPSLEQDGRSAPDYKFWCFSGRVECLTVHCNRLEMHYTRTFDRNFQPYKFPFYLDNSDQAIPPPPNFETLVRVAEDLSAGYDFIRVDMYNVRGRIFIGEFTVYAGGGFVRFLPRELDSVLGAKWPARPRTA